jgi:hypothetical protein
VPETEIIIADFTSISFVEDEYETIESAGY